MASRSCCPAPPASPRHSRPRRLFVTDKSGKAVRGLTAEDFEIEDGGNFTSDHANAARAIEGKGLVATLGGPRVFRAVINGARAEERQTSGVRPFWCSVPPVDDAAPHPRLGLPTLALLAALVSFGVGAASLARNRPLGDLSGMADEWLYLGFNLAIHGTLGLDHEPILFRPPGYPAFVAAVLRAGLRLPPHHDQRLEMPGAQALYVAHILVLAAASALVCLWLGRRLSPTLAFLGALLFGANPYSVILTTYRHYDVLHWLMLIAGCLALEAALSRPPGALRMFGVGAWWGLATLVRPVSLVLPPFVAAASFLRRGAPRPALRETAAFTLGLCLAIAPWTVRNYRVGGRFIPVNAQTWTVTWATTVEPNPADADRYKWYKVANAHYLPLFSRVTGVSYYNFPTFARMVLPLEDAFKAETIANVRRQPLVYLHNVGVSFVSLQTSINAIMLTAFRRIQDGTRFDPRWLWLGSPGNLARGPEAVAFAILHGALTVLAAVGLWRGLRARDPFLAVPVLVHLALSAAHALTYLDTLYYYVKLPFLVVLAFYGVGRLGRASVPLGAALTGSALLLSVWTLFW